MVSDVMRSTLMVSDVMMGDFDGELRHEVDVDGE